MRVLIYVGPAPSRDMVIQFSTPIVQHVASAVTLVTAGGNANRALLDDAVAQLQIPDHVPATLCVRDGNAQSAIISAAHAQSYDLAIFGRLNQPIGRLLPGSRSKIVAQRLQPSVLRVHGRVRPLRRILVASGGDYHTFNDVRITARIAAPLGAEATILHVISQQSLIFEGLAPRSLSVEDFLTSNAPEAQTLRDAAAWLRRHAVPTQVRGRIGPVVDEILAELRVGGYDLLVIGAHRVTSPLDRILLEDITDDLLDLSSLPVLIVKGDQY